MIGLDNDDELAGWLRGEYEEDKPILPAGGISVYCQEHLNNIFSIQYDNPMFVDLGEGEINQPEFRLKLQWGNCE